jgi:hypothetical protein
MLVFQSDVSDVFRNARAVVAYLANVNLMIGVGDPVYAARCSVFNDVR